MRVNYGILEVKGVHPKNVWTFISIKKKRNEYLQLISHSILSPSLSHDKLLIIAPGNIIGLGFLLYLQRKFGGTLNLAVEVDVSSLPELLLRFSHVFGMQRLKQEKYCSSLGFSSPGDLLIRYLHLRGDVRWEFII